MPEALIHFFSATGNSRLAAEVVGMGLEKANWTVSMKNIRKLEPEDEKNDLAAADFIGFVFPIYAFRAAIPMEMHISALPRSPSPKPVFLIATYAGYLDRAFMRLRDFLLAKNYVPVITSTLICEDAWTAIRAPGWVYDQGWPTKTALGRLLQFSMKEIPLAWERNRHSPKSSIGWVPYNHFSAIAAMYPIAIWRGKQFPIYVKKSLCTKCGKCVRQCPMNRLRLEPYPKAKGNCAGCYGCINSCPVDAINTWFTFGKIRYRGPAMNKRVLADIR